MCIITTPPSGMTGRDLNLNVYNVEIIYTLYTYVEIIYNLSVAISFNA